MTEWDRERGREKGHGKIVGECGEEGEGHLSTLKTKLFGCSGERRHAPRSPPVAKKRRERGYGGGGGRAVDGGLHAHCLAVISPIRQPGPDVRRPTRSSLCGLRSVPLSAAGARFSRLPSRSVRHSTSPEKKNPKTKTHNFAPVSIPYRSQDEPIIPISMWSRLNAVLVFSDLCRSGSPGYRATTIFQCLYVCFNIQSSQPKKNNKKRV